MEFRAINDAYNRLISHVTKLEVIEAESKLSNESVIIEVRKKSVFLSLVPILASLYDNINVATFRRKLIF